MERKRAYKFALDPNAQQTALLEQYAGAARHAYNLLVAENKDRGDRYHLLRDHYAILGYTPKQIKTAIRRHDDRYPDETTRAIGYQQYATQYLTPMVAEHREAAAAIASGRLPDEVWESERYVEPWLHTVPRRVHVSGLQDADKAMKNWFASLTGQRKRQRVGRPRFKKKGRSRDSFTLPKGNGRMGARGVTYGRGRTKTTITDYRHVYVPTLSAIRTHDSTKRLYRSVARGGRITSATLSRSGKRWYASILVQESGTAPTPTRKQQSRGTVGVDVGVKVQAALSTGEIVDNLKPGTRARKRVTRIQRALSRTERGSNRAKVLQRRLAATQHHAAQQRATAQHALTKRLATEYAVVAIEDLNVSGMTSSAKGTVESPGSKVRQKAGLNRAILDVGFAEIRRQLTYKTSWYGSQLTTVDRFLPTSKTCYSCGTVKTKLSLSVRVFECECGYQADRDVNAARNIAKFASPICHGEGHLAAGRAERENGRGGRISTSSLGTIGASPSKRQDSSLTTSHRLGAIPTSSHNVFARYSVPAQAVCAPRKRG